MNHNSFSPPFISTSSFQGSFFCTKDYRQTAPTEILVWNSLIRVFGLPCEWVEVRKGPRKKLTLSIMLRQQSCWSKKGFWWRTKLSFPSHSQEKSSTEYTRAKRNLLCWVCSRHHYLIFMICQYWILQLVFKQKQTWWNQIHLLYINLYVPVIFEYLNFDCKKTKDGITMPFHRTASTTHFSQDENKRTIVMQNQCKYYCHH